MKRLMILFALVMLTGCDKEKNEPQTVQDCNCDRVVSHTLFNLPSHSWGEYTTVNDCTGVQEEGNWSTQWGDEEPIDGECL